MGEQETVVSVLSELLRLYDWRQELARMEAATRSGEMDFDRDTARLLRQYGREKKAAWEAARRVLGEEPAKAWLPQNGKAPEWVAKCEGHIDPFAGNPSKWPVCLGCAFAAIRAAVLGK